MYLQHHFGLFFYQSKLNESILKIAIKSPTSPDLRLLFMFLKRAYRRTLIEELWLLLLFKSSESEPCATIRRVFLENLLQIREGLLIRAKEKRYFILCC